MFVTLRFITIVLFVFASLMVPTEATKIYAWGRNQRGQLGTGSFSEFFALQEIPFYSELSVADVTFGYNFHFAILEDGSIYAAGANDRGQLGVGAFDQSLSLPWQISSLNPVLTRKNHNDVEQRKRNHHQVVSAGYVSANYMDSSINTLYGWGQNSGYVLGLQLSDNTVYNVPSVSEFIFTDLKNVISGHYCVYVTLLNDTVFVSGANQFGQLGLGFTPTHNAFSRMTFWDDVPLRYIVPSQSPHICAVAANGSLYCWGSNSVGQCGVDNFTGNVMTPTRVAFFDDEKYVIAQVSIGGNFTTVLTCGGKVFVFGSNEYGQLGQGYPDSLFGTPHPLPLEVTHLSNQNIVEIVTGTNQNYARSDKNEWFVWGGGQWGTLATGTSVSELLRPYLSTNLIERNITHISSGSQSISFYGWNDPFPKNRRATCDLVNECHLGVCDRNAKCTDFERGYGCACYAGFVGDGFSNSTGCIDIDECLENTHHCAPTATCVNNPGNYTCDCGIGFDGDGFNSKYGGSECSDIDECSETYQPPVCAQQGGQCNNTVGSYLCECASGYDGNGYLYGENATGCTDIDECANGYNNTCHSLAICTNTNGGYYCSCPTGYSGNGYDSCVDIDECSAEFPCDFNANCSNTIGGFTCQCTGGYTGNGIKKERNGQGCIDIDECKTGNFKCGDNEECVNKNGSYICSCMTGYSGDGHTCTPICSQGCNNGGKCVEPDFCDCSNTGYTGYSCSNRVDGTSRLYYKETVQQAVPTAVVGAVLVGSAAGGVSSFGIIGIIFGVLSNLQMVNNILLINVEFPEVVADVIGRFSWCNLHFLPPWVVRASSSGRQLLSIPQYAYLRHTIIFNLFPSNIFSFAVFFTCCILAFCFIYSAIYVILSLSKSIGVRLISGTALDNMKTKLNLFVMIPLLLGYMGMTMTSSLHLSYGSDIIDALYAGGFLYFLAILIQVLYVLGFALFILLLSHEFEILSKFNDWMSRKFNRENYGFIFGSFREGKRWWAAIQLTRKGLVSLCVGLLWFNTPVQIIAMILIQLIYGIMAIYYRPFRERYQLVADCIGTLLFIALYIVCFVFYGKTDNLTPAVIALFIICISIAITFVAVIIINSRGIPKLLWYKMSGKKSPAEQKQNAINFSAASEFPNHRASEMMSPRLLGDVELGNLTENTWKNGKASSGRKNRSEDFGSRRKRRSEINNEDGIYKKRRGTTLRNERLTQNRRPVIGQDSINEMSTSVLQLIS